MSNFRELISERYSTRKFKDQPLTPDQVEIILAAALQAPSSKNQQAWEFVLVEDKEKLKVLSQCKRSGSKPIDGCALAVIVLGDPLASDVWIEDASIAAILMQLQAEDLGLGSCWIQIRERFTKDDKPSDEYVREVINAPLHMQVLSIIAIGYRDGEKAVSRKKELQWEKLHIGKY